MNERLEQCLEKILEYLEAAEGTVVDQAPLVAQEIITLGRWNAGLSVGIPAVIFLVSFCYFWWHRKRTVLAFENEDNPVHILAAIISGIGALAGGMIALFEIPKMLTPFLAPRLYVIKVIRELL